MTETQKYQEDLKEIRKVASNSADYWKTLNEMQKIALRLAEENFNLRMDLVLFKPRERKEN